MFQKILAPIDGSEIAWRALDYAKNLGEKFSSAITVFYVVQQYYNIPSLSLAEAVPVPPVVIDDIEEAGKQLLAKAQEKMQGYAGQLETKLEFGHPAERILTVAREGGYDAIVIGSRGLSGIAEFMLGSVSSRVAQYARIPVLIIK